MAKKDSKQDQEQGEELRQEQAEGATEAQPVEGQGETAVVGGSGELSTVAVNEEQGAEVVDEVPGFGQFPNEAPRNEVGVPQPEGVVEAPPVVNSEDANAEGTGTDAGQ